MRAIIFILMTNLFATVAPADIAFKAADMAPGTTIILRNSDAVVSHVRRNSQLGLTQFDLHAGDGDAARFLGSYMTNATGAVVRESSVDGQITRYVPHRCNRSVGLCSFTVVHANGDRERRQRITVARNGGLVFEEFGDRGLLWSGHDELEHTGAPFAGWRKNHVTGEKTQIRKVTASYP